MITLGLLLHILDLLNNHIGREMWVQQASLLEVDA